MTNTRVTIREEDEFWEIQGDGDADYMPGSGILELTALRNAINAVLPNDEVSSEQVTEFLSEHGDEHPWTLAASLIERFEIRPRPMKDVTHD